MTISKKISNYFGFVSRTEVAKLVREMRKRSFEAVQINRLTKDFVAATESINAAIRAGGQRLRDLSRQQYENNSTARRWVDLFVTNVVGENGHTLQCDIKILEEQQSGDGKMEVVEVSDDEKNNLIEKHFAEWSKPENCSVTHSHSYATIQKILARHKSRDGEAFLRRVVDPDSKYGIRLQIIPPELIAESYTAELPNGNVVVMGIEYNIWRQPVAYYILKNSIKQDAWGFVEKRGEMDRIPASEIRHYFDPEFSNQGRGYTRMANVILMMTWMKDYNRASVLNAKFSARKLGFLTDANPEDPIDKVESDTTDTATKENASGQESAQSRPAISGEELTFTNIGSQKLEKWDPQYPHEQHEMFNRVSWRDIATGLNVAYCSLSGDYSNSTWSSSRTELEVERKGWKHEQRVMIETIDEPIFEWWLEIALIKGAIPGFRFTDFQRLNKPYFTGPSFDYINPVDESNALRSDLEAQFISPFDVAAKKGKRPEDVYREIDAARRLRKKFNLPDPVYGNSGKASTGLEPMPAPAEPATNGKKKNNGVKENA